MVEAVIIGQCELYLGDCLEIMPTLQRVDACITDPPYGLKENAHRVASRGKLAKTTDYGEFTWDESPASKERIDACRNSADTSIIWGGNYFELPPARCWLVWDKVNGDNCFADCEMAWTNIEGSVRMFQHMWNGMLRASEKGIQRVHPAQKPVALLRWCIERAGNPKSIIDPFMGSGTTLVAAAKTGIKAIGIEREPKYFDIACKRIEEAYKQPDMFVEPVRKPEQMEAPL